MDQRISVFLKIELSLDVNEMKKLPLDRIVDAQQFVNLAFERKFGFFKTFPNSGTKV